MNLKIEKAIKNFFNKYFWRQHPEAALRYLPVIDAIKKAKLKDSSILEIGSGSLGIVPYITREIDGVDIDFSGPQTKLLKKIKGDATKLPFRKNSYDVVISVDVLEHLRPEDRPVAVFEALRVAKKLIVIVVPVGKGAEKQDYSLNNYWQKIFHSKNQFLSEHVRNGLPTVDQLLVEIDKSLRKLNKNAKVSSKPNLNLTVRNVLMRTWITKNKYLYYLYMKGFLLLVPLLKYANSGNCYRRVLVIEFLRPPSMHLEPSMKNSEKAKGKLNGGAS